MAKIVQNFKYLRALLVDNDLFYGPQNSVKFKYLVDNDDLFKLLSFELALTGQRFFSQLVLR